MTTVAEPLGPSSPDAAGTHRPARPRNRVVRYFDPRESAGRFASLDGYRAIAALGVLVYHVAGYARLSFGETLLARFLHNLGNFGVATFFVLSGFLLYRPFVAAFFGDRDQPDPMLYLRRRLVRIWPAYVLALGVFLALGLNTTKDPGPDYFFTLFTLTQVYRKAYGFAGLAVAWTLCIEVAFYLALPLLAAFIRWLARAAAGRAGRDGLSPRMKAEGQLIGLATLVGITFLYRWLVAGPAQFDTETYPFTVFHLWLPNYFDWFALGMVLAVAIAWKDLGRPVPNALVSLAEQGWLSWGLAAGCYVTLMLVRGAGVDELGGVSHETPTQMFTRFALNGMGAFFFLLPGILGPARHPINRVLASFVPMFLGTISYGIYLWHKVWIDQFKVGHETGADRYSFGMMLGLVLAASIVTSALSYYLLERPLLRFKDPRRLRRAAKAKKRAEAEAAAAPGYTAAPAPVGPPPGRPHLAPPAWAERR